MTATMAPAVRRLFPTAVGLLQRVALVAGLGWVAPLAVRTLREVRRIASV